MSCLDRDGPHKHETETNMCMSYSHGRDHKLRVWKVRSEDFASLSVKLPAEASDTGTDHGQPWLLHSLSVNAINFCAFSMCSHNVQLAVTEGPSPQLIASPNGLDSGGIDIFQLPSEKRISQIKSGRDTPTGMVMAVSIFHETRESSSSRLVLVSGYEDGRVMVHIHQGNLSKPAEAHQWQKITTSRLHTQPVLSLSLLPSHTHFLTSSADATIAKSSIVSTYNTEAKETQPEKAINTKHAGQQGLSIRSDAKIFATAGWDGRVRVYSCKTIKELAVLKWHKVGCYSTAFADVNPETNPDHNADGEERIPTSPSPSDSILKPTNALDIIKQQREEKAQRTHWLAAGGKDGKISLWDIY